MHLGLQESELRGATLLVSCFSAKNGAGGLFTITSRGVERLDSLHATGLYAADGEFVRVLRADHENDECTVEFHRSELTPARHRIAGLRDGHDIVRVGDDYAAASAATNSIAFFSSAGALTRRITFAGEGDAWHLNSLLLCGARLFACAFGRFQHHRKWDTPARSGAGIVFDVLTNQNVISGLTCPHHPRLVSGRWLICNSGTSELLEVDPLSGIATRRAALGGWTRGLAVTDEFFYVGVTPPRHAVAAGAQAHVAVVSRANFTQLGEIKLPVDEIYDVIVATPELVAALTRPG